jgi:hypothetical protein
MNYKRGNPGCCTCGATGVCGCTGVPDLHFSFTYFTSGGGGVGGPVTWAVPYNSGTGRWQSTVMPMPAGFVWTGGSAGCVNGQVTLTPGTPSCIAQFDLTDGTGAHCLSGGLPETLRLSGVTCSPFHLGVTQAGTSHPVVQAGTFSP